MSAENYRGNMPKFVLLIRDKRHWLAKHHIFIKGQKPSIIPNLLYVVEAEKGTKMENKTILLVEDNPDDADLTLLVLKKYNIVNKVFVVHNGVEALDFLFCRNTYEYRNPFDMPQLILMEIKLPGMNGLQVLRCLREDFRTRLLPVMIFTSSKEEEDVIESYKIGANSFVRKPIIFTQFVEAVRLLGFYWLALNEIPLNLKDEALLIQSSDQVITPYR